MENLLKRAFGNIERPEAMDPIMIEKSKEEEITKFLRKYCSKEAIERMTKQDRVDFYMHYKNGEEEESANMRNKELTNTFAHNSDDDFIEYVKNERDHFIAFFNSTRPHKEIETQVHSLIIAYDQMIEKLSEK